MKGVKMITVNDWVKPYVESLFKRRGYNPEKEEVFDIVEEQWTDWKRLVVQSGLNSDKNLADDVAYEFSTKRVVGGAGRIFEHFADFVLGKPKQVREFIEDKYRVKSNVKCQNCDGRGVVIVPITQTVDGEDRTSNRAFKCECEASVAYSSLQMASPQMLEWAKRKIGEDNQRLYEWSRINGLDESNPAEYRSRWAGLFTRVTNKNRPRLISNESNRSIPHDTNGTRQIESRGVLREDYAFAESGW